MSDSQRTRTESTSMANHLSFSGTKIALLCDGHVLTYLRDAKPEIPFANKWDLPGGGREGLESPTECALRELREEFGLIVEEGRVHSLTRHSSSMPNGQDTYFCVAELLRGEVESIRFGNEGQCWKMMPIAQYLRHENAVPHLQSRLRSHCEEHSVACDDGSTSTMR